MKNINTTSLEIFGVVPKSTKCKPKLIPEYGVFVTGEASHALSDIKSYLKDKKVAESDLNKTFHKSWKKIAESTREELFVHQIIHYMTTYGTNFEGVAYIPFEELDTEGKQLPVTIIGAVEESVLIDKCIAMLSSGIALKEETIKGLVFLLDELGYKFEAVDWINNNEAKILVMDKHNVMPKDPVDMLRYMVFKLTGSTLVIKSNALISAIKESDVNTGKLLAKCCEYQMATIFNRYKPIFLAFKKDAESKRIVNLISRLSKTAHRPMVQNALNLITSQKIEKQDMHWLENATTFALFRALNVCTLRLEGQTDFVYKIRNGKSWAKSSDNAMSQDVLEHNKNIIMVQITERLKHLNDKKIFIPEGVEYALPTSEKMFVGNIPMGTVFSDDSLAVGVYWHNSYGANDLDLSGITDDGDKVGWDSSYNSGGILYSGDMTNAHNGAVEYLYTKNSNINDIIVKVNCYNGDKENHSYKVIVGTGDNIDNKYMMNPENLVFAEKFNSESGESITGVLFADNDKVHFAFYPLFGSSARVSSVSDVGAITRRALIHEAKNCVKLRSILSSVGANIVESADESDIDLSIRSLDKNTFIDLLSQ